MKPLVASAVHRLERRGARGRRLDDSFGDVPRRLDARELARRESLRIEDAAGLGPRAPLGKGVARILGERTVHAREAPAGLGRIGAFGDDVLELPERHHEAVALERPGDRTRHRRAALFEEARDLDLAPKPLDPDASRGGRHRDARDDAMRIEAIDAVRAIGDEDWLGIEAVFLRQRANDVHDLMVPAPGRLREPSRCRSRAASRRDRPSS